MRGTSNESCGGSVRLHSSRLSDQLSLCSHGFGDIGIRGIPDLQECSILHSRSFSIALSLVSLCEMIMRERVIRIDAQYAIVFGNRFIKHPQLQISIGKAIFICIRIPIRRPVLERLFEILDSLCRSPTLQLKITTMVVKVSAGLSRAST